MANNNRDRRQFQRVPFESPAVISQSEVQTQVRIVDCSLKGVLVEGFDTTGFDLDQSLQLTLSLANSTSIVMELSLVHQRQHGSQTRSGFQCTAIDLDSIAHLRRLLELNLGEIGALDRDLSELIDLR